MIPFVCSVVTAAALYYVFFFPGEVYAGEEKTRLGYLRERKEAVYENLRDLNFEYLAGLVFEIQIAQVLVDRFLALAEIAEARLFFSGVNFAGKEENVVESGGGDDGADERDHRAVSFRPAFSLDRGFSRAGAPAPHLPLLPHLIIT